MGLQEVTPPELVSSLPKASSNNWSIAYLIRLPTRQAFKHKVPKNLKTATVITKAPLRGTLCDLPCSHPWNLPRVQWRGGCREKQSSNQPPGWSNFAGKEKPGRAVDRSRVKELFFNLFCCYCCFNLRKMRVNLKASMQKKKKKSLQKKKKGEGRWKSDDNGGGSQLARREGTQSAGRGLFSYRLRDTWCKWQCRRSWEPRGRETAPESISDEDTQLWHTEVLVIQKWYLTKTSLEKVARDMTSQHPGWNHSPMGIQSNLMCQLRNIMTMAGDFISVAIAFLNVLFIKAVSISFQ